MQVGDLLLFNDGSHVLVLRLHQRHGRTLCRVWLAGSRKASKDILVSRMTMEFNDAKLVGRNVRPKTS